MEKTIYNMELHEIIRLPDMRVVRVPGGWIYLTDCRDTNDCWYERPVFVPFNGAFLTVTKNRKDSDD